MPRTTQIADALGVLLGVHGAGPQLTRYYRYCPDVFTFWTWLYDTGRVCPDPASITDLDSDDCYALLSDEQQPGRSALFAILDPCGVVRQIPGTERTRARRILLNERTSAGASPVWDMFHTLHAVESLKVGNHYTMWIDRKGDAAEELHRVSIPIEVLAALPWETTKAWLSDAGNEPEKVWYHRTDDATFELLERLIQTSFSFDSKLRTVFWDTVDAPQLVVELSTDRQIALNKRLRAGESLSDRVLEDTIPVSEVLDRVDRETVLQYLGMVFKFLGSDEPPQATALAQVGPPAADPRQTLEVEPGQIEGEAPITPAPTNPRDTAMDPPCEEVGDDDLVVDEEEDADEGIVLDDESTDEAPRTGAS